MNPHSPILDQPQTIDWTANPPATTARLANQELYFEVDAQTDLLNLFWPWAGECYAKRIALRVSAPREEDLIPMVTRLYPGHQELIMGTEGVILTKRVAVPHQSDYDRSVIWLLDCQAEGDRLLRLDVEIDWGEARTQRMVDGLLVAQRNPGPERGLYSQSNAELTCVFGNPQARPDHFEIDSPQHAKLVYHVLVNGMVEVPLLLALSDVGEQVAWNGFLALRDADRAFELSGKAWEKLLKSGRLWTPEIRLNQALQASKLAAARHVQRLRTGFAATDGGLATTTALIDSTDSVDITLSRNLLAHLRRVAEATVGRLPQQLPLRPKLEAADPGEALVITNGAYLAALTQHLHHHFAAEILAAHYEAVGLCTEQLLRHAATQPLGDDAQQSYAQALRCAYTLAQWRQDEANAQRWQNALVAVAIETDDRRAALPLVLADALQRPADQPWYFAEPWTGIRASGRLLWDGCGISWRDGELWIEPTWPATWSWWALLNLPYQDDRTLSLVWDGTTLHATQPVHSLLPIKQWQTIRARNSDELEFDLHFELQSKLDGEVQRQIVRADFHQATEAAPSVDEIKH